MYRIVSNGATVAILTNQYDNHAMPHTEIIHNIPHSRKIPSGDLALAQSDVRTAMQVADMVRQWLTLLRVSLEQPTRFPYEPQDLITEIDNALSAFIKYKNDQLLVLKLNIPQTPQQKRADLLGLPPNLRL